MSWDAFEKGSFKSISSQGAECGNVGFIKLMSVWMSTLCGCTVAWMSLKMSPINRSSVNSPSPKFGDGKGGGVDNEIEGRWVSWCVRRGAKWEWFEDGSVSSWGRVSSTKLRGSFWKIFARSGNWLSSNCLEYAEPKVVKRCNKTSDSAKPLTSGKKIEN